MKVITIGRGADNDVDINDPHASRHHLQIIQHDDGHFSLSDFGSTNGTYVNGQKISGEIALNDMDIVRIGNTTVPWRIYFDEIKQDLFGDSPEKGLEKGKTTGKPIKMKLKELSSLSTEEINQYLAEGARFVRFSYVISIIVMTFKRESPIYFLSKDVNARKAGWPYTLITSLFGWWGIPYGLIYTIKALSLNSEGRDVTEEVFALLNKSD